MKNTVKPRTFFVQSQLSWVTTLFVFILLLAGCANPVSPTGGPKDEDPPLVLECTPPNGSTHFISDKIEIRFDEFVQLKDVMNQIMVSPPNLNNTDYRLRGKSLLIKFDDTLAPNTTYTINLGDAVSDITEGNILKDFSYVFSTGEYLDSLTLKGVVVDAFDLSPQKGVFVMLYLDQNDTIPFDSLPCLVKPLYLGKTDATGAFTLKNLSDNSFKFFALKDQNSDYLFNQPDERIAFTDSLVKGFYIPVIHPDTLHQDSISQDSIHHDTIYQDTIHPDTIQIDSVVAKDSIHVEPITYPQLNIRLFKQNDSIQKLLKKAVVQEGQLGFFFRYPTHNPVFTALNLPDSIPITQWNIEEVSRNKDSIYLWLNNIHQDSLYIKLEDNGKVLDTLGFNLKEKTKKKKEGDKPTPLSIASNVRGSDLKQFTSNPLLSFPYPLASYDFSRILFLQGKSDTIHPKWSIADSIKRIVKAEYKWQEDQKYRMLINDSTFFTINGQTNDSIGITFNTSQERSFGTFHLKVNPSFEGQFLIQLLDEKSNVLDQRVITSSTMLKFAYLNPKTYKLKAIFDRNKNGRWDTGDYFKKVQPEGVTFFPKGVEIRANWEVEESWDLQFVN